MPMHSASIDYTGFTMSLYAIGDLHLSEGADKPMGVFGDKWNGHADKLRDSFSKLEQDDVCVLCGDLSWGMSLEECRKDFILVDSFPGKKILLKGNHDYWWSTASKARAFFDENKIETIDILHNNYFVYNETAICGTRGWFFEEETGTVHDRKIMMREVGRLKTSLEAAGDRKKIVFLHYPPVFGKYCCNEIIDLLKLHGVRLCCYGHIHGSACYSALNGWYEGIEFKLVSADFLNFEPYKIID